METTQVFDKINELVFDDLPCLVSVCDLEGTVLFCNKYFVEYYGMQDLQAKRTLTVYDVSPQMTKEYYEAVFNAFFVEGKNKDRVFRFNSSVEEKVINFSNKPVLYKNEKAILSIGIDITSSFLKQKEEADFATRISEINLNRLHKTLIELDKAKKISDNNTKAKQDFMANISHEIRTPLNAILGFSQILDKGTYLNLEQKKQIEAISDSAKTLNAIINDVLDFSKIEAGKMTFELTPVSLTEALDRIIRIFEPKAKEKNNSLHYEINIDVPSFIQADEVRLNQVFINLIGNAIKFTDNGTVKITVEKINGNVKFEFSDTGIGIAEDKLEMIFDSYSQADVSTTRKYGGTGLGLSIVKKLVSLQGGSINVKSKVAVGSVFTVILPLVEVEEAKKPEPKKQFSEALKGKKILVVEDHPLNKMLVEQYLKTLNTEFVIVNDGEEAVLLLTNSKVRFDAILMDIQLPGKNGHEITRILRKDLKICSPIIALTANAFDEEHKKCLESGMNDYLKKPFYIEDLYKILKRLILDNEVKIDLTFLKNYTNNNKVFAKQILDAFVMQTPLLLEELKQALSKKDNKKLKAIAHKLIPSAVYVGLVQMENTLKELELANEDGDVLNGLVNKIVYQSECAIEQIEKEIFLLA